ncbi:MAG: CopG family transcriptional regulator [Planctomycetia bacterium]|nr:CopG family transcriptional regulator [Planctomycetia bacterium]
MKTNVEVKLAEDLLAEARNFVNEGCANSLDELLAETLRRYLDSHAPQLTEKFILQDVEWGLHGHD